MTNKQIDENRSKHGMADGETNREMVGERVSQRHGTLRDI